MSIAYTFREGVAGFRRAKFAAFTAISALVVALVLVGLFGLLIWQGQQVTTWLRQQVGEVEVYLDMATDARAAAGIEAQLEAHPAVEAATFVSREEAFQIFQEEFGEGAEDVAGTDFLPASFRVRLKGDYVASDSIAAFAEQVGALRGVESVDYASDLLPVVETNLAALRNVGLGLGLLVVLAALFLVGNTIRLTIYARRMLIRTMKLVGATDGFIRQPFLFEGLLQGLIGGFVAALVVVSLYGSLLGAVPQLEGWPMGSPLATFGFVLLAGAFLGWLGSLLAVRRFIKGIRLS